MTAAYHVQMLLRCMLEEPGYPPAGSYEASPEAAIRHWIGRRIFQYIKENIHFEADARGVLLQDCAIRWQHHWQLHGREKLMCSLAGIKEQALVRHNLQLQVKPASAKEQYLLSLTDYSFFFQQQLKGKLYRPDPSHYGIRELL